MLDVHQVDDAIARRTEEGGIIQSALALGKCSPQNYRASRYEDARSPTACFQEPNVPVRIRQQVPLPLRNTKSSGRRTRSCRSTAGLVDSSWSNCSTVSAGGESLLRRLNQNEFPASRLQRGTGIVEFHGFLDERSWGARVGWVRGCGRVAQPLISNWPRRRWRRGRRGAQAARGVGLRRVRYAARASRLLDQRVGCSAEEDWVSVARRRRSRCRSRCRCRSARCRRRCRRRRPRVVPAAAVAVAAVPPPPPPAWPVPAGSRRRRRS